MAVENEAEQRARKQRTFQALIAEKRAELDRFIQIICYKSFTLITYSVFCVYL